MFMESIYSRIYFGCVVSILRKESFVYYEICKIYFYDYVVNYL